jgi:hypothetical protein
MSKFETNSNSENLNLKPYRLTKAEMRFVLSRAQINARLDERGLPICYEASTLDGRRWLGAARYKKDLLPELLFRLEHEEQDPGKNWRALFGGSSRPE